MPAPVSSCMFAKIYVCVVVGVPQQGWGGREAATRHRAHGVNGGAWRAGQTGAHEQSAGRPQAGERGPVARGGQPPPETPQATADCQQGTGSPDTLNAPHWVSGWKQ